MLLNRKQITVSGLPASKRLECLTSIRSIIVTILIGLVFLTLVTVTLLPRQSSAEDIPVITHSKRADFKIESKSRDAELLADWVVDLGDNGNMPFAIVDKIDAKVFLFDYQGKLKGAAPCLLGLGKGDDSVPGIGARALSSIKPEERTTPAGRFLASLGQNYHKKDVLWIDYDLALSMHRIVPTKERLQRMATTTPSDNRISFGCINVPNKFYESLLRPTFAGTRGIVYILPETKSIKETFAQYYDVK